MTSNRFTIAPILSAAHMGILDAKPLVSDSEAIVGGGRALFSFLLDAGPLKRLIADASSGRRVYELMSVRRPADLYDYLWVEIADGASALAAYARERYKGWNRYRNPLGTDCAMQLVEFDSYFRYDGEDTDEYYYRWLAFRDSETWHKILNSLLEVVRIGQAEVRKHDDFLAINELSAIENCIHHCDFLPKIIRDGRRIDATGWGGEVPKDLYSLILKLAVRSNVNSVSCPYIDADLWRSLVSEQVRRAKLQNADPQLTYALNGPDGGIPYLSDGRSRMDLEWGGYVHIPYEGACGSDLFIQPDWFEVDFNTARTSSSFNEAVFGLWGRVGVKSCKYFVTHLLDLGPLPSASRTVVDSWAVYWELGVEPPFEILPMKTELPC